MNIIEWLTDPLNLLEIYVAYNIFAFFFIRYWKKRERREASRDWPALEKTG